MTSQVRAACFYGGVFVTAGAALALQILITRILSVMLWYSMAFFAISMAMLGMTVGALIVYFLKNHFRDEKLSERLALYSLCFALSIVASCFLLITSMPLVDLGDLAMTAIVFAKLIVVLAPPFAFGGIVISLALTRCSYPIGVVYAVDLIGAASGCFLVLVLMSFMDGVSAILAIGALACVAAMLFQMHAPSSADTRRRQTLFAAVAGGIAVLAAFNSMIQPNGARVIFVKGAVVDRGSIENIYWNSFTSVFVGNAFVGVPFIWGPSPRTPYESIDPIEQKVMRIDGDAGTPIYRFNGDRDEVSFLQYDITNLAYRIRNSGQAGVIGVGGGRDVLSAHYFGFERVTGVDINPIFIHNLTDRYADYNRLAQLDGVELVVDEARSWFARSREQFDVIQMSLIDTWAATGVGAFSLTENGLYTVEAWTHFIGRLTPDGVLTVSRWYSPENPGETGRLLALAKATLFELGAENPNQHIFLAATRQLATIIVSPTPLSASDLEELRSVSAELEFDILVEPEAVIQDPIVAPIYAAQSTDDLMSAASRTELDTSPPTDERPFFFNQLRLGDALGLLASYIAPSSASVSQPPGVASGNFIASAVLLVIILVSLAAVVATIILPTLPALRRVEPGLVVGGSTYFLLIGLGFMFAEIGFVQRLSVFLGHPVYGLAIALAGIILATGAGAALSEIWPLRSRGRLLIWAATTGVVIASIPFWFPPLAAAFATSGVLVRGIVSVTAILPAGILLGFGFPTGMRLVGAISTQPTPWFWAVNGAAGVLASGLAVAVSVFGSISATLWIAAACYLLVFPASILLLKRGTAAGAKVVLEDATAAAT